MSRFYFHLWLGDRFEHDEVGLECADADAAYIQAFHAAQDIWIEQVQARQDPRRHRFEVADVTGRVLFEIPFVEVINRAGKTTPALLPIAKSAERNGALVSEVATQISRASQNVQTSRQLIAQLDAISRAARR